MKNIILNKENEILNLKLQLQNNADIKKAINLKDIIVVHFTSTDGNINYPIKCLPTDIFADVEKELYQKYEEYREMNNQFISGGNIILRFKKILENGIKDGDKVQLLNE